MSSEAMQVKDRVSSHRAAGDAQDMPLAYKRTEVGLVPADWDVVALGTLCSFENGDRGSNYPSPGSFVPDGVPFINAGHLSGGLIDSREMDYITRATFNRLGGGKVRRSDILFCLRGTLGKFGVVGPTVVEGAIASSLVIVRPKSAAVTHEFVASYFASDLCSRMIEKWAGGAAQPNLGAGDLARFWIPTPSTLEQRAIAEALSDVDGLLGALEALMAKKRAVRQAAMQQLLTGKSRLPDFSGEWETKRIDDIAPLQRGFDLPTARIKAGNYPVVYSNGVLNRHNASKVKAPGVVTGRSGTIGKVHYVETDFWPHNTALWVTSFRGNDPKFIYYLYTHLDFTRFLSGSGVPTLNRNDAHQYAVQCPKREEQAAIAAVLSDMDAEIAALEARRDKTRAIKQGMMQQLLTGRVRLVKPEAAA